MTHLFLYSQLITETELSITEAELSITEAEFSISEAEISITETEISISAVELSVSETELSISSIDKQSSEGQERRRKPLILCSKKQGDERNGNDGEQGRDECRFGHE